MHSGAVHGCGPGADRGDPGPGGRGGRPAGGVPATGIKLLVDEDQSTAIFVGFFESEEDMRTGSAVLDQMDSSDTPGNRASVDLCEVKLERDAG